MSENPVEMRKQEFGIEIKIPSEILGGINESIQENIKVKYISLLAESLGMKHSE